MDNSVARPALLIALFIGSFILTFLAAAWHDFPAPDNDSIAYLAYARSVHVAGVYAATAAGPAADSVPGREPLYSLFIAGLAKLYPAWGDALKDCSPPTKACANGLLFLKYANVAFLSLTAMITGAIAQALGGSRVAVIVAASYVSLSFTMWRELKYVISDYLAVLLTSIAVLSLVFALRRPGGCLGWIAFATTLALLVLTKHIFLPFALLFALGLLLHGIWRACSIGWRSVLPGVAMLTVLAAINGTWALRNIALFGATNDGRGSIALSTREVFDHMTPGEHAVAFVWFMRQPGPGIAKRLFAEEHWRRFEWTEPEGFYLRGQVTNHDARVERLMRETGASKAVAESSASALVVSEIIASWTGYLASMPAIFYRGLWFDAFMPLSLPLFVLPFIWARRERRWLLPLSLSPALWSLFIYPVICLNVQRYQFTVVVALAVTAGLAADRWLTGTLPYGNENCRRERAP